MPDFGREPHFSTQVIAGENHCALTFHSLDREDPVALSWAERSKTKGFGELRMELEVQAKQYFKKNKRGDKLK